MLLLNHYIVKNFIMFYLVEKNTNDKFKLEQFQNEEELFTLLHQKLINLFIFENQCNSFLGYSPLFNNFTNKKSIMLSWENKENGLALGFLENNDVFLKETIDYNSNDAEYNKLISVMIQNIDMLLFYNKETNINWKDPNNLTKMFLSNNLTNFWHLNYVLKMDPNIIYQSFIYYLNKTIKKSSTIKHFDLLKIIDDFLVNNNDNKIKMELKNLLLFYLTSKNINPLNIEYIPNNIIQLS